MGCLLGCLAIAFPRVALTLVWLFGGGYVMRPFDHWAWPLAGLVLLPTTTLAFVYSMNSLEPAGQVPPLGWVLIALGLLLDLGLVGGGQRGLRRRRRRRDDDER